MPLLKTEAEKLSNNMLEKGVIQEIIDRDDLFAILPFKKISGKAYVYNREGTLSEGTFIDPNETVTEGASTFTTHTTTLKILIGDVDVDKFLNSTMSDVNAQKAIQIAAKAKGIGRQFRKTFATGDESTNAKEFDGLAQLCPAAQIIAPEGATTASLTMSSLDELLDKVKLGADAIVMRSEHVRAYRALLRAAGGIGPQEMMIENFGRPMITHNGTPILVNDFLPEEDVSGTATASIYAIKFNEVDGVHGIYGGESAGIVVEELGTVQNKDATRTRLKWYCGTCLKSTQSIARLTGIVL